jgi:hypothetical protein
MRKSAKSTPATGKKPKGFTDVERAAMKERAKELRAEGRVNKNKADRESDMLARIVEMPESERTMAKRLHEIIKASAPQPAASSRAAAAEVIGHTAVSRPIGARNDIHERRRRPNAQN